MVTVLESERRRDLIRELAKGALPQQELKSRSSDCRVLRIQISDTESVILKIWNRPGLRGLLRRLTRTLPFHKEQRGIALLRQSGVRVPAALGHERIQGTGLPFTDALFLEDLGTCTMAVKHVKRLMREGREEELQRFVDECVEMTRKMVAAGILDLDHHFMNIVATPSGRAARLDLEIARRQRRGRLPSAPYGEMLGRLIGTFSYAVQPDHPQRVIAFSRALAKALAPRRAVLRAATAQFDTMRRIEREKGFDMMLALPWDTEKGN
jgi:hypothetical protein